MSPDVLRLPLNAEADVVVARRQARACAQSTGLGSQDQIRLATAVSEIARNALLHGNGGTVSIGVESNGSGRMLVVRIDDGGPGIEDVDAVLEGRRHAGADMGIGLASARRLVDEFLIQSAPGRGTTVLLKKRLPPGDGDAQTFATSARTAMGSTRPTTLAALGETDREMFTLLSDLRRRQDELEHLSRELEDTNRGVVALYAELEEKAESLRRANEARGHFLSSIGHEFRTPLNSIRSLAQLLLGRVDGTLTPEQEKQIRFIRRAADELRQLVDDLLDLAKIDAGKLDVRLDAVAVTAVWSTLRGLMRPLAINPAVELVFGEAPPITVVTDEGKLAQILRNLVSNALKFTERGTVRAEARLTDDAVVFEIADTGIGIAPEHLDSIFDEFVQIDSPLQRAHKGTGLGLPLCRKLAGLLGATLDVKSEPGVGSCFTLRLPLLEPDAAADRVSVTSDANPALVRPDVALVLLADADELERSAIRRELRPHFAVRDATDGAETWKAALQMQPDAIVLAGRLPGIDVPELLRRLAEDPRFAAARKVVVAAPDLPDAERRKLTALGAQCVTRGSAAPPQVLALLLGVQANGKSH